MKYKVSLLPEARKKRIISKQKIEKYRGAFITILVVIFALFAMVLASRIFAGAKLNSVVKENEAYQDKVDSLSKYREISAELESKMNLINSIQVEEPYLHQFVVAVANVDQPGISITSLDCEDWNTTRTCTIQGTCSIRQEYLKYKAAIEKLDCVASVSDIDYASGFGTEDGLNTFTIQLTANGGSVAAPDLAIEGELTAITAVIDENAGVE